MNLENRFKYGLDKNDLRDFIRWHVWILKQELRRQPSKNEILDLLFTKNRGDPEAQYLERRLRRVLAKYG